MSTLPPPGNPAASPGVPPPPPHPPARRGPKLTVLLGVIVGLAAILGVLVWEPWSSEDPPNAAGSCSAAQQQAAKVEEANQTLAKLGTEAKVSDFQAGLRTLLEARLSLLDEVSAATAAIEGSAAADVVTQAGAYRTAAQTARQATATVLDNAKSADSLTAMISVMQDPTLRADPVAGLGGAPFAALTAELAKTPDCAAMLAALTALTN